MPRIAKEMTFGDWQVVERCGSRPGGGAVWHCKCVCGKNSNVSAHALLSGHSHNCGCKRRTIGDHVRKHGFSQSRLYSIWNGMRKRCQNPSTHGYENYGGKGICVCEEWDTDVLSFRKWALANGYEEGLTIDRIDGDADYCPTNCRWVTRSEQNKNRKPQSEWKNHLTE